VARNFHQRRTAQPIAELNVTNLIDLGFMLLVIFMIVAPMMEKEQKMQVNLPVESASAQPKLDPTQRFETVTIQADGRVTLGSEVMTLKQLANKFAAFAKESKPPVMELRFDAKSTAQQFVSVMDEMKKAGLKEYAFDTQTRR
jgi:biopolymer transport protein TolR